MRILSNENARNFLVNYQNLNGHGDYEGEFGVQKYIEKVGCIQYDPLNVVGRNPDLVLQARVRNYKEEDLFNLLYDKRILVDGTDKVLSIFLLKDYPKMSRIREATIEELKSTLRYRGSLSALEILDEIKEFIRNNGAQTANSIDIGGRATSGRWGHKKLSSAGLDFLFHSGQLGIRTKQKTQKVYDLSENLFPKHILTKEDPFLNEKEFLKWYIKRRVGSIGLVWNKNGGAWVGHYIQNKNLRMEIIHELVEEGELLTYQIEGSKEVYYMRKEDVSYLEMGIENNIVQFIAPLDNFIWDRGMIEELFNFRYSWEVYTPVAKRKYGYYVLPVLYKNQFVARFEPKKNGRNEPLDIKNWWWEPGVKIEDDMVEEIGKAFRRFSSYLCVDTLEEKDWKTKLSL